MEFTKGKRVPLADFASSGNCFEVQVSAAGGVTVDFACFGLTAEGKLVADPYMTFYGQKTTPCGGVAFAAENGGTFLFNLDRLPASVDRLTITAAIDGAGSMSALGAGALRIIQSGGEVAAFAFTGIDFTEERAVMLLDIYRKNGAWSVAAVGQGFNGGLDALVRHFGADVASTNATTPAPVAAPAGPDLTKRINLEKRIAREAPQLVNLRKNVDVSLAKVGLGEHRARCCLILDISVSMDLLYRSGKIQRFAERVFALATRFDDDGEIDIFLFGRLVHKPAGMTLDNFKAYIVDMLREYALEGGTNYGLVIQAVINHYFPHGRSDGAATLPVFGMFVTDGNTQDRQFTVDQIVAASYLGIFFQFMGIGRGRKAGVTKSKNPLGWFGRQSAVTPESDFPFLEELDDMPGRLIDNVNFFAVSSPDEHGDEELYDLLMAEYPTWVKQAKQKGLIT